MTHDYIDSTEIEAAFKEYTKSYYRIYENIFKEPIDWIWYGLLPPGELSPYYHKIFKIPEPRKVKTEPSSWEYRNRAALDEQGRVLISHSNQGLLSGTQ